MFEAGNQLAEYPQPEYGGRRWRQRQRWGQSEGEYGQGEYGQQGEGEYGQGEYGQGEYGQGEGEYGQGEYGQGEYGQQGEGEYGQGEYGQGEGEYGQGEYGQGEYGQGEQGQGESEEERFLPLIPLIGNVLGGLLGGGRREAEGEYRQGEYGQGEYGQGEYNEGEAEAGEAEEQFLHKIFQRILGREAEYQEIGMSPNQEAEFAARLLEVTNEQEMEQFLGGIVNLVGRAVQGIRGAANSPQGRALINAVKPLAKAALPAVGGAIGSAFAPGIGTQIGRTLGSAASSLLEAEAYEMSQEQQEFEAARRVVRLTAAAARDVATAPSGAPPEIVAEFSVFRGLRRHGRPLYRRGLRRISPFARRYWGRRYGGFRRGYRYGGGYRGYYGAGRPWGYRGPGYTAPWGYPPVPAEPGPEPAPEPPPPPGPSGPPAPGYRWVAVPIGAPAPEPGAAPAADGAAPEPAAGQSEYGWDGNGPRSGTNGGTGQWVRRNGKIIVMGA